MNRVSDDEEQDAMSEYGMSIETGLSMEEAEARVRTALADEGFGVLTEIDVAATLKAKLDIDRPQYKILGACNPSLAHRALTVDESIGLLLPCNVTLSESADGTRVSIVDPVRMLGIAGDDDSMRELSSEARERLERALHALSVRT